MASVNKVIIVGNLGRDPEVRYSASGDAMCNITVATTETWKDKQSGEKKEATEWHRISFFGRLAEEQGVSLEQAEKDFFANARPTSLIKRFIDPAEVANLVAYVCSPLSSATHGAALRVEGGVVRSMV